MSGEFRGRIVHYKLDFEVVNSERVMNDLREGKEPNYELSKPFLRRTPLNKLPISKKTKNKSLITKTTLADVASHCASFAQLANDLQNFASSVETNYPHPFLRGLSLSQALGLSPKTQ